MLKFKNDSLRMLMLGRALIAKMTTTPIELMTGGVKSASNVRSLSRVKGPTELFVGNAGSVQLTPIACLGCCLNATFVANASIGSRIGGRFQANRHRLTEKLKELCVDGMIKMTISWMIRCADDDQENEPGRRTARVTQRQLQIETRQEHEAPLTSVTQWMARR